MKRLAIVTLSLVLFSISAKAAPASALVKIGEEPQFDSDGRPTGVLTEYFADKKDVDASYGWAPDKKPQLLLPLNKIIERSKGFVQKPKDDYVYAPPDFRGLDLREMGGIVSPIWYWEVHFWVGLDSKVESQIMIRDGGGLVPVKILPNGGQIHVNERKMTPEERTKWGVDPSQK